METETTQKTVGTVSSTLEQKSTEILNWLEVSIKQTSAFVAEQTPQFIQELLAWNFYNSLIWFIIGVLMLATFGWMLRMVIVKDFYTFKENEKYFDTYRERYVETAASHIKRVVFSIFGVLMFIFGTVNVTTNTDWFKIKIAPRVYLLDYAMKTLKK